jgi:transcriptional regulator with XRE-family HTH domain
VVEDGRLARIGAGLSQAEVGRAIGSSHARIGRLERGEVAFPDLALLSAYCAVVGLELAVRAYPAGDPIRDRAQLALLDRFRARVDSSLRWRTEVPIPIGGDLRAWDAEVAGRAPAPWRARIEAETNIPDGQALERRLNLKARDDPRGHVILLVSDTRANRVALRAMREGMRDQFPLDGRALLNALSHGRDPGQGGIVIL